MKTAMIFVSAWLFFNCSAAAVSATAVDGTATELSAASEAPACVPEKAVSATVPGVPTGVGATAGNAQATVTFTAPASNGGSAITSYTVTSSPGNISKTGKSCSITLTGLKNGTTYTFTVTATNKVGTGLASNPSNSVTPEGPTVPGAPTVVSATAGNAQATVTFTAPASNGGSAITSYTVTSSPGNISKTGKSCSITLTGLKNGTTYTFTVTATNKVGAGLASSPSNSVTPTGPTVPDAPTGVSASAGNAQATVTFTPPAWNGGSTITGYTVTSSPGGISKTGKSSPITVVGLANGTDYTFTVTAINKVGAGQPSDPSNDVTPVGPSVVGSWDVTGKLTATCQIPGYTSKTVTESVGGTITFNPDHSFSSDDDSIEGTWAQQGSTYTLDVRQSLQDSIVQALADLGYDATFEIDSYSAGGKVSFTKISLTTQISGTFEVYDPVSASGTCSETLSISGPPSTGISYDAREKNAGPEETPPPKPLIVDLIKSLSEDDPGPSN